MNIPKGYEEFVDSLKICSFDKENKRVLVNDEEELVNFDKVVKDYAHCLGINCPNSADALFLDDGDNWVLVEFKSGSINPKEILHKIYDSAIVLCEKNNSTAEWLRRSVKFILVCPKTEPKDKNKASMENLFEKGTRNSSRQFTRYIYGKVQGYLYKETLELTPEEFKEKYLSKR